MSKQGDYEVSPHPDGGWQGKEHGAKRASVRTDTQKDAIDRTRQVMEKKGGGELNVKGTNGRVRQKNTIPPAKDPRRTKG